jgi:perosamine synthetase
MRTPESEIIQARKSVLPENKAQIVLHEPVFGGNERLYVKECIDTGWVSSVGSFVDKFERELAEFTGVKKAVAVVNGTAALHVCLILAGIEAEDEVIVPSLTFIATVNAVTYCRAAPHFADSESRTRGIDEKKLREHLKESAEIKGDYCYNSKTGRRIRAVLPMHTFGHPVDLDAIADVCRDFKLLLIEDTAESIGSYYKEQHTGNKGLVAALSFNGNKTITTGGGGAVLTNDEELGNLAKHLTTQAKIPHRWEFRHDMIGYNYRLPNINAALGVAQMEQLPEFLRKKREWAKRYKQAFQGVKGAIFVDEPEFCRSNFWLNAILLDEEISSLRDVILEKTNDMGIMTRPVWELMHTLPMFAACPKMDLSVAESISKRLINIPSSANIVEVF